MVWLQNYDPFGSPLISTAVAALPIVLLLGLLASGRVSAPLAALLGLVAALLAAIFAFTPQEAASVDGGTFLWGQTMLAAAGHGAAFGLFPIGWIVLAAIFFYSLTVATGQFEIVKASVVGLSADRRVQALLIAFSFGAFLEGAAGFGTPVAISAALLMGAGFKPLYAAGLAATPFLFADRAGLAGLRDGRRAGHAPGVARPARRRRQLCPGAVPRGELPRAALGGRGRRRDLALGADPSAAFLATAANLAVSR